MTAKKLLPKKSLNNEAELLERCRKIEGISFAELAAKLQIPLPFTQAKGWVGLTAEKFLGSNAGTKPLPDFQDLGIELKTLPCNSVGKPAQSTFVTSISLLTIHKETWLTSQCFKKLKRVLWLPVEAGPRIPLSQRRVGRGFIWSPNKSEIAILAADWNELTFLVNTGHLEQINGKIGRYLQIRPKAANAKELCYGYDDEGNKVLTLPRGFYLRCKFTAEILAKRGRQF